MSEANIADCVSTIKIKNKEIELNWLNFSKESSKVKRVK